MSGGKVTRSWRRRRVRERQRQEREERRSLKSHGVPKKLDSSIGDIVIHRGKHKGRRISELATNELVGLWGSWNGLSDERRLIADRIKPYVNALKNGARRERKAEKRSRMPSTAVRRDSRYRWTHPSGTMYSIPVDIDMGNRQVEGCPFNVD